MHNAQAGTGLAGTSVQKCMGIMHENGLCQFSVSFYTFCISAKIYIYGA